MKKLISLLIMVCVTFSFAQDPDHDHVHENPKHGHTNENKFKQLYDEFATPNMFRTGSGAPGPGYYQQQADYKIDVVLNDDKATLTGSETITYTNNSPDPLSYLWVQLDQNVRAKDSKSPLIETTQFKTYQKISDFTASYVEPPFEGGFNLEEVKDSNGKDLAVGINRTMMRIQLPKPLNHGESFEFSIKWWYNINDHVIDRARSGYEQFEDGNREYVIAQFYPRMAVYNDVEGWQNSQFWGRDEFALPFGNFEVNITVPSDHIMEATGELQNRKEVYTSKMMERYEAAKKSYNKPVVIVMQKEAEATEKGRAKTTKTWKYKAENVRDFGFATSRKFILDMMAVKIGDKDVMAVSIYPKEGNPLWEQWSTRAVASTLKSYSRMTFDYPYPKAVSVNAKNQGMEYPMICWNHGRPDKDGKYSDRTKFGMVGVIIHEVGHNFFPMIVNSDERQWTWMDEGLNTFLQYIAEQDFGETYPEILSAGEDHYPSRRGPAKNIIPYMAGNQDNLAPIMTKGLNTYQFGNNAYAKPATALNILRTTVMGKELFDYSFKEYTHRWMFKHPTPEDFFRTMEDASAFDLDWFWRGWFYTTDFVDIGINAVESYELTNIPSADAIKLKDRWGIDLNDYLYLNKVSDNLSEGKENPGNSAALEKFVNEKVSSVDKNAVKQPKYFYNITFDKPGGLVMPIIVEYTYADGTKTRETYPAQIWRHNDHLVTRAVASEKPIVSIMVDPDLETADVDTSNNSWPRKIESSEFDKFKNSLKK